MRLSTSARDHAAVIALEGEFFGSLYGADLQQAVDTLIERRQTHVVLDLGSVTLMDSAGLGALIEAATALRAVGGDLRVAALEGRMRNLFLMTRLLGRVFELYPTAAEAAESFANDLDAHAALHSATMAG